MLSRWSFAVLAFATQRGEGVTPRTSFIHRRHSVRVVDTGVTAAAKFLQEQDATRLYYA